MNNYEKLIKVLKEIFQLDQADLDFGIYRIMNQKRDEIEKFLTKDLLPQVRKSFEQYTSHDKSALQQELDKTIENAKGMGIDPETVPKVKELREKMQGATDVVALENEVFSLLANFFRRYYKDGDFISMRRYKKDVYAIPYEGEEVKLHWANHDQYYIKSSEYFKNYSFKISDDKKVTFELLEADTEQNNNKAQEGKERRFAIAKDEPVKEENGELKICFTYEVNSEKQDKLLEEAFSKIKPKIPQSYYDLLSLRPTEKNKNRTLLEKHLKDYTARNTFDYFIHKDLGGFLKRELDFYIKNEVLFIDDINTRDEAEFTKQLSKIKALKEVAQKIIAFLEQLENFQKKLWLKKKFVVETNYCITLDRVPEQLYADIIANKQQTEEWIKLFAIDEIKAPEKQKVKQQEMEFEQVAEPKTQYNEIVSFTNPLSIEFLKANPYLVLDTVFFSDDLKTNLLASINNIDEQMDGLLIHSENYQGLNAIENRYKKQVQSIYIDPPYNAKSSEILYKNTFKHSSWLSLIENRVAKSKSFLADDSVFVTAIDEVENNRLGLMYNELFEDSEINAISVVHNPTGQQGKNFSFTHEFAYFVFPQNKNCIGLEDREQPNRDSKPDIRPLRNVSSGKNHLRESAKNCFYPIYIKNGEIIGFGDVCDDDFHPGNINLKKDDGVIEVYPIDPSNIESKWVFARETVESILDELTAEYNSKKGIWDIIRKKSKFRYKSLWSDKRYSANSWGSVILNNIIPNSPFDYPKSIFNVSDCIDASLNNKKKGIIIDYFAGSGTTGHAVIELNRNDEGNRKYILIEMGEYFDNVTKPRIQKVIYSKDWKDGKPVSREGISHCFKYIRLESYEDTLNNLELKRSKDQGAALLQSEHFGEDYLLSYMLDVETDGSSSLLNTTWFTNPFDYKLKITRNNEIKTIKVDLPETFNYLIGLVVETIDEMQGFKVITGKNLQDEKILVIWRNTAEKDNKTLDKFFLKQQYNTRDNEFDRIYVNGDNNLENLKIGDEKWKVVLIEEEFKKRMFDVKEF